MEQKNKKTEEVLRWLKQLKRLSTSRFVGLMGLDYDSVKKLLEDLENKGLIIKEEETNSTYWSLNKNE